VIIHADVVNWAKTYDGPKFHALLCDCPYEYSFMNKKWDGTGVSFQPETWEEIGKHLHPGAFGMTFAGSRTYHRIAVAIEDAGFRLHPAIFAWVTGQGFPKSTRIDRQVWNKETGEWRFNSWGEARGRDGNHAHMQKLPPTLLAGITEGHRYGLQAMKPALEPIIVFQKPYSGKPVECITATGAGALNIDQARIGLNGDSWSFSHTAKTSRSAGIMGNITGTRKGTESAHPSGRWPANFALVHHPACKRVGEREVRGSSKPGGIRNTALGLMDDDAWEPKPTVMTGYANANGLETVAAYDCHPDCPVRKLGEQSGERTSGRFTTRKHRYKGDDGNTWNMEPDNYTIAGCTGGDTGTAARFFYQAMWNLEHADPVLYCAKASRKERDAGLDGMDLQVGGGMQGTADQTLKTGSGNIRNNKMRNPHPTIKPLALCKWLATLLLPPAEYTPRRLLVPFAGVATEMIAAGLVGWEDVLGIELLEKNVEIGRARYKHWLKDPKRLELL
jgi:site-specific DNA-methyltransferase (adenine-specific)